MSKRDYYSEYRYKYNHAPELNLNVPVDVMLELSSHCNMRCEYCYHSDQKNLPFQKGFMKLETAEKILRSAAKCGVHSLKFNYRGEGTLNPHFKEITTLAKTLSRDGTFIDRITNSNFKFPTDKEEIFEGLCNQTKVKVSYDSFNIEVFEKQRAGGVHEITTRNIDKFYFYPFRKDTKIVIQAVRTLLNKNEDIAGMVKARWPEAEVSVRDMVSGRVDKDLNDLENKERDISERQPCIQAFARLVFDWTGTPSVCCPDIKSIYRLPSIHEKSVHEIFQSVTAHRIRDNLKTGLAFNSDPCKTCSSFESYKGFVPNWDS